MIFILLPSCRFQVLSLILLQTLLPSKASLFPGSPCLWRPASRVLQASTADTAGARESFAPRPLSDSKGGHPVYRTSYSTRQLQVLGHYGDPLCVDGAKVAVLEESDHEGFRSLLKSQQRLGRPTVGLYRHGVTYFPDKASKGKLAQEEIRGFLVLSNLLQSFRSRPVPSLLPGSSRGRFRGLPSGRRRASRSRCLPPLLLSYPALRPRHDPLKCGQEIVKPKVLRSAALR